MKGEFIKLSEPKRVFLLDLRNYLERIPSQAEIRIYCPVIILGPGSCEVCRETMGIPKGIAECPCSYYGTKNAIKTAWIAIDEGLDDGLLKEVQ